MSTTLVSLWTEVRQRLEAAGVDTPVLDARLLLEAGAGVSRLEIVTDPRRTLEHAQVAAVEALVLRREAREPISHIVGHKHFWTLDLVVTPDVLTPRPETEFVVEAALQALPPDQPTRVLDLGAGSGAILLAVLKDRPLATGIGTEISPEALNVAQRNAAALDLNDRIEWRLGDWAEGINEVFDVVVSNPPYIASSEINSLSPEVARYEPRLALDGGPDGLEAYRQIVGALPRLLKPGGLFALEVGWEQAAAVEDLAHAVGLSTAEPRRDLAGIPRVVVGERATTSPVG